MSKHIYNASELQQYGINVLTGEACGYGMRILCDVNEDGEALLSSFFGIVPAMSFSSPWNSTVNGKKATGSIMLTVATMEAVAVFALLRDGCTLVIASGPVDGYMATGMDEEDIARWGGEEKLRSTYNGCRWYRNSGRDRNLHVASGRLA